MQSDFGKRRQILRNYVDNFTSNTTAHGFSRANAQQNWVRLVWVGIVMSALLGAIFHATQQVTTYLQYPVSSTNRMEPNSFEFPDLTMCDPLNKRFFHLTSAELAAKRNRSEELETTYSLVYSYFNTETDWRKERKAIEMIYTTWEHLLNITDVNIRPMDMVLYCTFDGVPCGHEDFQVFYHRMYTNCFTFRSPVRRLRSSGMDRGLFLLLYVPSADVSLKIDSLARLASGLENNGIRFQIHQRDTIPHPLEYGIMAPTGTLTAVGLEQVTTSLANTPTHPCIPREQLELYDNQFDFTRTYERQLFDCIKAEYHQEVRKLCHCVLESHVIVDHSFNCSSVTFCHDLIGMRDPNRVKKIKQLYKQISEKVGKREDLSGYIRFGQEMRRADPSLDEALNRMLCSDNVSENVVKPELCYDSCNYNTYSYSLSQCPWPEDSFKVRNAQIQMIKISEMLDAYRDRHKHIFPRPALTKSMQEHNLSTASCQTFDTQNMTVPDQEECKRVQGFVRRSIVQLRVYPETLTVRHTIEERSYELVNLCSDFGGVLGLWIGFSIVTIFEFIEIFIICASYYWYRLIGQIPRAKRNPMLVPKKPGFPRQRQQQQQQQQNEQQQQTRNYGRETELLVSASPIVLSSSAPMSIQSALSPCDNNSQPQSSQRPSSRRQKQQPHRLQYQQQGATSSSSAAAAAAAAAAKLDLPMNQYELEHGYYPSRKNRLMSLLAD